jgi:hypothetical protein
MKMNLLVMMMTDKMNTLAKWHRQSRTLKIHQVQGTRFDLSPITTYLTSAFDGFGKDCPYPHPEKITQAEITGWKSFYKKLSTHRVKSTVDLLLPRLPEEQKKLHSIEANDAEVPIPRLLKLGRVRLRNR